MRNCSHISSPRESCTAMFLPYGHGKSSLIMFSSFLRLGRLKLNLQHAFNNHSGLYIINFYIISLYTFLSCYLTYLKLNIQKMKIMASGPITSWQIDGETTKTVTGLIFLGSKITADGDCSHEINRNLLLGRKAMTNLDNILKSRDIILPTKVHLV